MFSPIELNSIFSNLLNPDPKILKRVQSSILKEIDGDGEQGEHGEEHYIYEIMSRPGTFVKFVRYTDSYGDNHYVNSIEFVSPVEQTIITYKKIHE